MRAEAFLIINCFVTSKNWNLFVFNVFFLHLFAAEKERPDFFHKLNAPPICESLWGKSIFLICTSPVCFMYSCPLSPLFDCRILHWVNVTRSWIPVWKKLCYRSSNEVEFAFLWQYSLRMFPFEGYFNYISSFSKGCENSCFYLSAQRHQKSSVCTWWIPNEFSFQTPACWRGAERRGTDRHPFPIRRLGMRRRGQSI